MNYKEKQTESIYQVFVRNHSVEGTFDKVIEDIPRIASMGFDYLYLLPIHPNSKVGRKGDLGSPYAISDYLAIDEAYGTLDDFKRLIKVSHDNGMNVMMDIVLNHTGRDHAYTVEHPEYYYHDQNGKFINRVEEWTDVYDLNYDNTSLRVELIEMLKYWAGLGVDAFRCDVGSLVPIDFWIDAKREVATVNPDHFWLSESCHGEFIYDLRSMGYKPHSDGELYQAFDCLYNYDIHDALLPTLKQERTLEEIKHRYRRQEWTFPLNYIKLNCLENHDQPRIQSVLRCRKANRNWTAFSFFNKGMGFVYAGQEFFAVKEPSLFTKDTIEELHQPLNQSDYIKRLIEIKKLGFTLNHTRYEIIENPEACLVAKYVTKTSEVFGIFNVRNINTYLTLGIKDGTYTDMISGNDVVVENGCYHITPEPVIFEVKK